MHLAHRVELVVLTREERLQLERRQPRAEGVDRLDQLGVERVVARAVGSRLLGQLQQGECVVQHGAEPGQLVEVG